MANSRVESLVEVRVEPRADTPVLVDLFRLVDDKCSLLVDLFRDSVVLANEFRADSVVDRVEKVEETGRDALFFCRSVGVYAKRLQLVVARLTVKFNESLNDVVAENVSVGNVLCDNGGLWVSACSKNRISSANEVPSMTARTRTFGLSSCERGSVIPAPIGADPVTPVGRTEAVLGSESAAEVTSRWAPSSYRQRMLCFISSCVSATDVDLQFHRSTSLASASTPPLI